MWLQWKGIHFALSQSAELIFRAIKALGPLSQKRIISRTGVAERTVRYSLSRLVSSGLIEERTNYNDLREKLYRAREVEQLPRQ